MIRATSDGPGGSRPIPEAANALAEATESDVYLFSGSMYFPSERRLSACVSANRSRRNAILYLATFGGSADTAFRAARCLQSNYSEQGSGSVTVYVLSFCKSAGTLMAIGADVLVMPDGAELGPLDVQISKPDSLAERMSGLTPVQALNTLRVEAFRCFEECFLEVIKRSDGQITTRTASLIAVRMATGLFRPLYAQMDPMRLGEYQRSMLVADQYGARLDTVSGNLKDDAIGRLLADYPSHEFVIDRKEAGRLFRQVRPPTEAEAKLGRLLEDITEDSIDSKPALVKCLSQRPSARNNDDEAPGIKDRLVSPPTREAGGGAAPTSKPSSRQRGRRRKPSASIDRDGMLDNS